MNRVKKNIQFIFSNIIFVLIIFGFPTKIFPHQTVDSLDTTSFNLRFLNQNKGDNGNTPKIFILLNNQFNRGELENRNTNISSIYGERLFMDGLFSMNMDVSYIYFQQKNRSDATRYGKVFLGGKIFPFFQFHSDKNFFFYLEGRLGLPSGIDETKFIESNYYTGQGNAAFGYTFNNISFISKLGGEMPLTRYEGDHEDEDGVPYFLRKQHPFQFYKIDTIQLKRSSNISSFLFYTFNSQLSLYAGYLYRTPFYGIEKDRTTGNKVPIIFREAMLGLRYNFNETYNLTVSYRNPLYRGKDFRPYESSIQIAISINL